MREVAPAPAAREQPLTHFFLQHSGKMSKQFLAQIDLEFNPVIRHLFVVIKHFFSTSNKIGQIGGTKDTYL